MAHQVDINVDAPEEGVKVTKTDEEKEASVASALDMLISSLDVKFNEYAGKRSNKEAEWIIAERQYAGLLDEDDDKALRALGGKRTRTTPPVVNITRQKTNIAIARMQDIQFPTGGDYNFVIEPTEVPELKKLLADQTQPADAPEGTTVADMAEALIGEAWEAAQRMERQIQDRFTEAGYGKKARRAMDDMCRLGTAVLKGPVHRTITTKSYVPHKASDGTTARELALKEDIIPTIQWVDPRMWYPDPNARPGTVIDDSFEVHLMSPREVAKLSRNASYMRERIREVLKTDPDTSRLGPVMQQLSLSSNNGVPIENRYLVQEYHGLLDKKVLQELNLLDEEQANDVLLTVQGEVWFCNGICIRISLSPLEGDEAIPYVACPWEEDKSSVFGHGVPYLMRHAQRVVNSSWLMLLDNGGLTAGPQIVLNRAMIEPANREEGWEIAPMKIWFMTEFGANVAEAMQFVNIPTQQESIGQIIEFAMQFADIESSIPQIQAGEVPTANNTSFGGMAMLMTASHIIQQRVSETWDDNITIPLVRRFFDWEMQYNDDPSLQGDVEVKAGGATERIDKQIKAQDLERILGLAGTNPDYLAQIDPTMAFRELVATTRAGNILKSKERVERDQQKAMEEAQNMPPDPETIKANAAMAMAEAKTAEIQASIEIRAMEVEFDRALQEAKIQLAQQELEAKREENLVKLQLAQMERELKIMEIASTQKMSQTQVLKDMAIAQMSAETERLMKAIDLKKFDKEIEVKMKTGKGI